MKRIICMLLLTVMLAGFSGCTGTNESTVSFYYLRGEFTYGASDSVIVSEQRDLSSRMEDLNYLLGLYLVGPLDNTLRSPFPRGTKLAEAVTEGDTITIRLSEEFAALEDIHLTLAGACLASTCFDLTDASTVQIFAGNMSSKPLISLTRESLTLLDSSTQTTEATTAGE